MSDSIARLGCILSSSPAALKLISDDAAAARPKPGAWSRKEILGHLIDSAANNHQRFVRGSLAAALEFPRYEQAEWVQLNRYQSRPWTELLGLWIALNQHVLAVISEMPEETLRHTCSVGGAPPVTLQFLIDDYVVHLEQHLATVITAADDPARLLDLYRNEWWTSHRERADVECMLGHTDEVIALRDAAGELVGFARVLTDRVYKALLLDVIVQPRARGEGLGRRLMDAVLAHPSIAGAQHVELYCRPELAPFYEKWGFTKELGELCFMRRARS